MKERPIILRDWQVRAARDGRLSQIWLPIKQQPAHSCRWVMNGAGDKALHLATGPRGEILFVPYTATSADHRLPCQYGAPGDRVWVRESHIMPVDQNPKFGPVTYRVGQEQQERSWRRTRWEPPATMPRWASRLTLELLSVEVARVHEVTEEDARACGVEAFFERFSSLGRDQRLSTGELCTEAEHRAGFAVRWDEQHDKRHPWSANPWCWKLWVRRIDG